MSTVWAPDARGQGECAHPYYWGQLTGQTNVPNNCFGGSGFRCYQGEADAPFFRLENPSCDPHSQACTVHLVVPFEFPGLIQMIAEDGLGSSPTPRIFWFDESTAGSCSPGAFPPNPSCSPAEDAICGLSGFGGKINKDFMETWVEKGGITCENAMEQTGDHAIRAASCFTTSCREDEVVEGLTFDTPLLAISIGCEMPPPKTCAVQDAGTCPFCRHGVGPDGGGPASGPGGGPGGEGGNTGPQAILYYRAGGVGHPGFPGTSAWNTELGRYWSHTYAKRIVIDPGTGTDAHVWLLTEHGTFHEFKDLVGGVYTTVRPSNEYRTLERTTGWELTELDGTVHTFDSGGRWTQTVDRNGNATEATYTSGELTLVEFPDGREEEFTYSSGRLDTITEVGVDGTSELEWTYTWTGLDLTRIDRPDGTALEYTYGDTNFPGYVTLVELIPSSGTARVVRGYAYDAFGNVIDMWAGATSPTPDGVDRWQYSFDNPLLPSETEVTDPLGDVSTYVIERDGSSTRPTSLMPKVISISDDCPTCGTGPNAQFEYGDPDHPLRPTRMLDGNGNDTRYEYTDEGEMSVKIEAFGTALERTTDWDYDPNFPGLVIEQRQPSVTGGTNERVTTWDRDSVGNATTVTFDGFENGSAFSLDTVTVFNDDSDGGGRPSSINPPGYGTTDVTSFTYHSRGNGNLILESRTDPLIGDTDYGYDAFNRLARVIDPNGVAMDTRYDDLDRVTHRIHRVTDSLPVTPPDPPETIQTGDLVTENVYNAYGDLDHTILPEGNVIDYEYDDAGRLISIERRPDLSNHGERQLFTLDDAGNRTRVDLQVWDTGTSAWVTRSFTKYHYDTRCHLDRVEDADGEITEYAYDCNGNLEKVWDAKHPSSGQTAAATQVYAYDGLDRLTSVTQPWTGTGGGNAVTSYDYDVQDHLVEVTDAEGNVTAYVYSDRDLLTAEASDFLAGGSCGSFPDCSQNGCGCTRMSYNEHGELVETTDPRGVTVDRTVDELDRVTLVEYPDTTLDTEYEYDDAGVSFSKGRLTAIIRHGDTHSIEYDRFGRVTLDGALGYEYDENGNTTRAAAAVGWSVYSYDYADRPATLDFEDLTTTYPVVTDASYEPFGPLTSLSFDNTVVETRAYDDRYMPLTITAEDTTNTITLLDWDYTVDEVGNVTEIDDLVGSEDREFAYQDVHYFLTCAGGGAWATGATCNPVASNPLQWTYDRIGNRLSEVRGGKTTSYTYAANGASGNTPLLTDVGTADDHDYDAAGNLIQISGINPTRDYDYDDEGRLAQISSVGESADLAYDGRSFLALSERSLQGGPDWAIQPRYSADGRLVALIRERNPGGPFFNADQYAFLYFAGRPVAVAELEAFTSTPVLTFYTTDHLGAPILVTDDSAGVVWDGGLEPFGADPTKNALSNEVFLRLPGQWQDDTWEADHLDAGLYYNVHRWYQFGTGRYTRTDPLKLLGGANNWLYEPNVYAYVSNNPIQLIDPLGLYGTTDCSYYDRRCDECGGNYYCNLAPLACRNFPEYPDPDPTTDNDFEGWARCTRQCLQDCDQSSFEQRKKCQPDLCSGSEADPATDDFWDKVNTRCHAQCYSFCHFWGTWAEGDQIPNINEVRP